MGETRKREKDKLPRKGSLMAHLGKVNLKGREGGKKRRRVQGGEKSFVLQLQVATTTR